MTASAEAFDERKLKWQGQAQLSADTAPDLITPLAASRTVFCGLVTTDSEAAGENETGHSSEQIKGMSATSSMSTTVTIRPSKTTSARIESGTLARQGGTPDGGGGMSVALSPQVPPRDTASIVRSSERSLEPPRR